MKKVGMILEGGGQRGIFTSGVLDYLMGEKLMVPYVVGVSAGACNAVDYVSGQILRTKECMLDAQLDHELYGVRTMMKTKYFMNMDLIFDQFPNHDYPFDFKEYVKSPMRCLLVTTNCLTGKAEYIEEYRNRERMMAACRASSSLPFAAPMVKVDGIPMMDGGLADSVPIRKAIADGFDYNIVILTRRKGYYKSESQKSVKLAKLYYRKYPMLARAIIQRNHNYNRTMDLIERLEEKGQVFVIRPTMPCVSRTERDLEKLEDFYWHGYSLAEQLYPDLKEWLAEREECVSRKRLLRG
ncbi:MAG: patatin family protein [Candidatus Choladocola sp.]|nr:patatin family protein [Candidatus Choladocola sp.]